MSTWRNPLASAATNWSATSAGQSDSTPEKLARIVTVLGIPLSYLSFDEHQNAGSEENPAWSPWLALTRPLTALSSPSFAQLEPLVRLWRETRGALTRDVDAALEASKMSQRMVLMRRLVRSSRLIYERIGGGFVHMRPCEGMLAIGHGLDEVPDRDYGARIGFAYMETAWSQSIRIESVRALVRTSGGAVLNTRYDRVLLPWRDRGDQFVMGVSLRRELTIWRGRRLVPFRSE